MNSFQVGLNLQLCEQKVKIKISELLPFTYAEEIIMKIRTLKCKIRSHEWVHQSALESV